MKRPFMSMIIPIIIGICFCYYIKVSTTYLVAAIAFSFLGLALCILKEKGYSIALIVCLFILGGLLTNLKLDESKLMEFANEEIETQGIVKEVISLQENYSKYVVETKKLSFNEITYDIKEKTIVKIYGEKALRIGDEAILKGIIRQPNENTNPGLFDYRLYLQTNNIFTSMSTRDYQVKVIDTDKLNEIERLSLDFRTSIEKVLDENLKEEHSSLMKSMLLGDSTYLDNDTENRFRELGLSHVLAVSGLHIGIISVFLIYTLGFVGLSRKSAILVTVTLIWIYGFCIGYPTSVLRASIMFSFLMLANIIYRRYDPINIISMSAIILLLYNPLWLFSVGFQFSFIATLSLFIFTYRIRRLFHKDYKNMGKLLSPLVAVQIGIAPIIIYHFNYFSPLSIISNLLVVPMLSLALIIAFIMIILSFINICIVNCIIGISGTVLSLLLYITDFLTKALNDVPFNSLIFSSPSMGNIIIYYLIFFVAFGVVNINSFGYQIRRAIFIYISIFTIITGIISLNANQRVVIDFIDVGQGDCSLITAGDKNFLVDGGGTPLTDYDVGEGIVLPYLKKKGISTIDGVFISHFHEDHCEGIITLIDKMKIKNIFIGYENIKNEIYVNIKQACLDNNIPITVLQKYDKVIINNKLDMRVLSSSEYINNINDDNNLSMVMLVNAYNKRILFTGDIEKKAEDMIVAKNKKNDIDLMKVPHHGSKTSSNEEFIDFFQPEYGVIQVGQNLFGHPNYETLKRYDDRRIYVYRNDNHGLVRATIDEKTIKIEAFLPDSLSIEEFLLENGLHIIFFLLFLWIGIELIKNIDHDTSDMEGTII